MSCRKSTLLLAAGVLASAGCLDAGSRPEGAAGASLPAPARAAVQANPGDPAPVAPVASPAAAAPGRGIVNVLRNPGFEEGRDSWTQMGTENWGAFDIVSAPTRSGARAAKLEIAADEGQSLPSSRVFGVVQELRADELPGGFPETLAGWYFVETWEPPPDPTLMYIQVVVIAWGDPRAPSLTGAKDIKNYQVRFMLGGSPRPAFNMNNAKYDFLSREQPPLGQWVPFEIPIRKRFQELWGVVPEGYEFLRILYEARWDHRPASARLRADVLYDDLFVGYGSPGLATPPPAER